MSKSQGRGDIASRQEETTKNKNRKRLEDPILRNSLRNLALIYSGSTVKLSAGK